MALCLFIAVHMGVRGHGSKSCSRLHGHPSVLFCWCDFGLASPSGVVLCVSLYVCVRCPYGAVMRESVCLSVALEVVPTTQTSGIWPPWGLGMGYRADGV